MTDEKPRRAGTQHDRDVRVTKTPPAGSRTITTSAFARQDAVPRFELFDTKTDPNGTELAQINHRAAKASAASQEGLSATTELRREVREDLGKLDNRMSGVEGQVGDLREGFGRVEGQLGTLVTLVEKQTTNHLQNQTLTLTAKLENDKVMTLDKVEGRKWTRERITVVVAALTSTGAITLLAGLLAKAKGC